MGRGVLKSRFDEDRNRTERASVHAKENGWLPSGYGWVSPDGSGFRAYQEVKGGVWYATLEDGRPFRHNGRRAWWHHPEKALNAAITHWKGWKAKNAPAKDMKPCDCDEPHAGTCGAGL